MNTRVLRADILLFLTAAIWGFAFVAQRVGMDHVGPLTFNGIRFALGAIALTPLIMILEKKRDSGYAGVDKERMAIGGVLLGLVLFGGATLQQIGLAGPQLAEFGLEASTAGKAGFITGLYVVFVPIFGLLLAQKPGWGTWLGATLAVVGMYLLSVTAELTISFGDLLVLIGALLWAVHVLLVGKLSPGLDGVDAIKLSTVQFAACAVLSLIGAVATEEVSLTGLVGAIPAIAYGGLMSVGIAYTLQVVAQRDAQPAHAAIILSLEAVFAAIGGCLMLGEVLTVRALIGCGLMLGGMLLSQLKP
ncbi:DMT family transporter [Pseudodesulfovibrio sp. S3]|uniref:DMT family transporter n=1 Tax=unclassified Pseudodesulfovibrio TaxID=2661612 RepID=UPI000FEBFDE8|nr:DMT family transporter [Pseudodesulfovibrio sp. S3]MCJ2166210.1 DMT family transporter [Pseudodesulfovibrio sp. S3-i]RWU02340.1 DMT family transporter [Pseudodesulfovibrio sp. S3]